MEQFPDIKQWDVTNKFQEDQHFWSVKTYQTIVIFFIVRKTFSSYYAMRSKLINTAGSTSRQLSFGFYHISRPFVGCT